MAAGPVIRPSGPRVVHLRVQVAYECKNTSDVVPKSHKLHARAHTHTHTYLCVTLHPSIFQCYSFISSNKIELPLPY